MNTDLVLDKMEILIFVTWAKKRLKMLLLLNRVRNQIKNTNRNFSSKLNSLNKFTDEEELIRETGK